VAATIAVAGCGSSGGSGSSGSSAAKNYRIGVSYQNLAFPFVAALKVAADNKASQLGVTLVDTDAKNDTGTELSNVEGLLSQHIDCLAFEAASLDASVASVQAANAAKVPVVGFNGKSNGGTLATFVGSVQVQSGQVLGKWLVDLYSKLGKPQLTGFYLRGVAGQVTDTQRNQGFKDTIAAAGLTGKITMTEQYANYDRGTAQSVTEDMLSKTPSPDFIVANNDDMLLGAYGVVSTKGLNVHMIGVDGVPESLKLIGQGKIDATVFQNAEAQGAGAVQACVDILSGKNVPSDITIPFDLVTQSNIAQYQAIDNRVYK
jgi:ABC-type sugar transport system substrate-binding protein